MEKKICLAITNRPGKIKFHFRKKNNPVKAE